MPELPDLAVVVDAFHVALAGRTLQSATAIGPIAVRGTPAELEGLRGQRLVAVRRRGKFVELVFVRDRVVVNAMLTGRFQLAPPVTKLPAKTTVVLGFGPRDGAPRGAARWTRGAAWLPPDDAPTEVRYRDPTQMGKVYLAPAGVARAIPGFDDALGPDADDPALTIEAWRDRIRRHPGELKPLLRNQAFVAGIGNAYSDEILHAARLSPFRTRASLASEEVDELYRAMRDTLERSIETLRRRVPPTFETQVRDFLAVHRRGGDPCPRCGTRISEVSSRSEATSWCRGCQR
ncbi:MAG TPA: DNA-formamidopyrimidine glycosylase family protein [Candidatus Sulfomarinibacteraceae bacterium]|nr:DNA-formamidopyrimidine glycosylase family protein [Candidatus Sulfomarinibacteraceae bacterium]